MVAMTKITKLASFRALPDIKYITRAKAGKQVWVRSLWKFAFKNWCFEATINFIILRKPCMSSLRSNLMAHESLAQVQTESIHWNEQQIALLESYITHETGKCKLPESTASMKSTISLLIMVVEQSLENPFNNHNNSCWDIIWKSHLPLHKNTVHSQTFSKQYRSFHHNNNILAMP